MCEARELSAGEGEAEEGAKLAYEAGAVERGGARDEVVGVAGGPTGLGPPFKRARASPLAFAVVGVDPVPTGDEEVAS